MSERRREVEHLDRLLARLQRREARAAVALLELERHPWYLLLDAGGARGNTAGRWAGARPARDGLWRDFSRLGELLRSAERARGRRRPRDADVAKLRGRLDDAAHRLDRVRPALDELRALVDACATTSDAVLTAITPVAERLAVARRTVVALELAPDDPDAVDTAELTTLAAEVERDVAADPLAFAGSPPVGVSGLAARVGALDARLDGPSGLRARWDDVPTALDRDLDELAVLRAQAVRADGRARAELRDVVPALPADRTTELRGLRDVVTTATGWRERYDAVVALGERVTGVRAELERAAATVAELIDRRDDLRGRFGAYRARTRRLGCVDDPELTELAGRIGTRLWSVPAEIARATRDLAAYRRRLTVLGAS